MALLGQAPVSQSDSAWPFVIPIVVALLPWVGAYLLKRFRPPAETREAELARLSHERELARAELLVDKAELRTRLDELEKRLEELEKENRRLRDVEFRQGRRIAVLERALKDANIPLPPDWNDGK